MARVETVLGPIDPPSARRDDVARAPDARHHLLVRARAGSRAGAARGPAARPREPRGSRGATAAWCATTWCSPTSSSPSARPASSSALVAARWSTWSCPASAATSQRCSASRARPACTSIASTGWYTQASHPPEVAAARRRRSSPTAWSASSRSASATRACVRATSARSAAAACPTCRACPDEEKVLRAAARAQARTGASLTVHPNGGTHGSRETPKHHFDFYLDVLEAEGADLGKVYMSHMGFYSARRRAARAAPRARLRVLRPLRARGVLRDRRPGPRASRATRRRSTRSCGWSRPATPTAS